MLTPLVIDGLVVPTKLLELVDCGRWPETVVEAFPQNLRSLVPPERIKLFAPDEDRICLMPPSSFQTLARESATTSVVKFWSKFGALHEICPELALVIADFGLGSDAPIVLDYRDDQNSPSVMRLKWGSSDGRIFDGSQNHWVRCADSFDEFTSILGFE